MRKKILLVCAGLGLFFGLNVRTSGAVPSERHWESVSLRNYRVLFQKPQRHLAEKVAQVAWKITPKYQSIFGEVPRDTIRILLANSRKEFDRLTRNTIPEWSQGVTRPDIHLIILMSNQIKEDRFFAVERHELVHAWMGALYPGVQTPRWFDEGIAVLLSGERVSDNNTILSRAVLTHSLLSLDDVNNVLRFGRAKARLAYAESYAALKFFVDYFGWKKFPPFFRQLKKTGSFDQALQSITGLTIFQYEDNFEDYVKKHYHWQFLFDIDLYLWLALPLFVAVSFYFIRRKNRKRMNNWADISEEEHGGN